MSNIIAIEYELSFIGRKVGAIGACYPIKYTLKSTKELSFDDIHEVLHDEFEHVREIEIIGRELITEVE